MAITATMFTIRTNRANRRLRSYWQTQAPPVGPVTVLLVTGETITVQPEGPQQCWTWWVRVPEPHLVDEVELPDLPPWTSIHPVPESWPKL